MRTTFPKMSCYEFLPCMEFFFIPLQIWLILKATWEPAFFKSMNQNQYKKSSFKLSGAVRLSGF